LLGFPMVLGRPLACFLVLSFSILRAELRCSTGNQVKYSTRMLSDRLFRHSYPIWFGGRNSVVHARGFGSSNRKDDKEKAYEVVKKHFDDAKMRKKRDHTPYKPPTWDFEMLSDGWDDVFNELTGDPEYAGELIEYTKHHYGKLGRGLVFIRANCRSRRPNANAGHKPEDGGVGFFDHPELGEVIALSPTLLLTDMEHDYITVEELQIVHEGGTPDKVPRLERHVFDALYETCKEIDIKQTLKMTGSSNGQSVVEKGTYDPNLDELVILMRSQFDDVPAVGLDLVRPQKDETTGDFTLVSPALLELMARLEFDDLMIDDDGKGI